MIMKKTIIITILLNYICFHQLTALDNFIIGQVSELTENREKVPLPFVNVYWSGTTHGTVTDETGEFRLEKLSRGDYPLVISFVGYRNDTVLVEENRKNLDIILTSGQELDEVTITKRFGGSYISKVKPLKTEVITQVGLQKLACCNLSESFENSATVDVGYSDAVTGAKHIKMLGLAGIYSQMLFENIPYLRGLESSFGLNYVPGPWMESIQISKGTASVMNGYESTTGQINIEYKKPENSESLYLNLFANSVGRMEGNFTSAFKVNDKWSSMILGHASSLQNKIDRNKDSFLDIPLTSQINLFNRWKYNPEGNLRGQIGFSVLDETRKGGQRDFDFDESVSSQEYYGLNIDTRKYSVYGKLGVLFPEKPYKSIGFITSATWFEQDAFFGLNEYNNLQESFYANLIYQTIIKTTDHKFNAGASYIYDKYNEVFNDSVLKRLESVTGVFGQYTYTYLESFTGIIGLRGDYHNLHGILVTPRIHIKYDLDHHTSIRGSAGMGYRTANVLAENMGILATSRALLFIENFDVEKAWNYGVNVTRDFHLKSDRELTLSMDFYRTDFINQVIVDVDRDVSGVYFYNLDGRSYSNSLQAELSVEPVERFDVYLAYRYNDVNTTYDGELKEVPLTSKYKGLLTLSYATRFDKWNVDFTGQLNGRSRLPDTQMNPVEYQKTDYSPSYVVVHAQMSRRFKYFDIYVGGENLTDFRQEEPIIASDHPFGEYFDASLVWGPLLGRRFYAGMRFILK